MTTSRIVLPENRGLFSNHYLRDVLIRSPEWSLVDHREAFTGILHVFEREKAFMTSTVKESQLENRFYRPILKLLGYSYEIQANLPAGPDFPDYALFGNDVDRDNAYMNQGTGDFYNRALAVGEVKRWDAELDRMGRDRHDKRRNPSFQIWLYLQQTRPKWGILSNGRLWRLYHQDAPLDSYYEVNLAKVLEEGDLDGFRYFYYFFRKEALIPGPDGLSFLDRVLKESETYTKEVGENLKENVYRAMRILARGFLMQPENELDANNLAHQQVVQENVMRLLYRLLFVLYAEGKGLLSNPAYLQSDYSLQKLKQDVSKKRDSGEFMSPTGGGYWRRLRDLFGLINNGSEASGIPREVFYVPPYNGGLFDPKKNEFLEVSSIGDRDLSEALDLLARSPLNGGPLVFVDYSTLGIRHLGSIYEGLLEYKIRIADKRMVAIGDRLTWIPYDEYPRGRKKAAPFEAFPSDNRAEPGDLFLVTDKGERKTTGSYYTPQFVVEHIVERSLEPIVRGRWERAEESNLSLREAILSIKVLDPAMGSGHFLVNATEYLAAKLFKAVETDMEAGRISEEEAASLSLDWAKREVVSHCMYGVDLNELAVELAKVSLWLTTISKEKPLSFLDHRLKCGNSLMGSLIVDLAWLPDERPKDVVGQLDKPFGFVEKIINRLKDLEAISDETVGDIKRKSELFGQLGKSDEYLRIRTLADVHTGLRFLGLEADTVRKAYMDFVNEAYYGDAQQWRRRLEQVWTRDALEEARNRLFFHWELEFPEVFFQDSYKSRGGFDAVIGNPPYVRIYRGQISEQDTSYFSQVFETAHMKFDLYVLFMDLGLRLLREGGRFSMIVPDKWMSSPYGEPLREKVLRMRLESVLDLRRMRVFEGVAVENVVPVIEKKRPEAGAVTEIARGTLGPANSIEITRTDRMEQSTYLKFPQSQIRIDASDEGSRLVEKIRSNSLSLGQVCYVNWGLRTGTEEKTLEMITQTALGPRSKRLLRGEDIDERYSIRPVDRFIDYDQEKLYNPMFPEFFESPKIIIRKISGKRGLMAAMDSSGAYCFSTIIVAVNHMFVENVKRPGVRPATAESKQYSKMGYLLALLNSKLVRWYYNTLLYDRLSVVPNHVKDLPIRRISFSTSTNRKSQVLEQAKNLFVSASDSIDAVTWEAFVKDRMSSSPEESDVLYEFLDFLADRLTTMQQEKNSLIDKFVNWLRSPVGLSLQIDSMSNKTGIFKFNEHPALGTAEGRTSFEAILAENKVSIGPEKLAAFREAYDRVSNSLIRLSKSINLADDLVDLVVYRMYGLAVEEIALIESDIRDYLGRG